MREIFELLLAQAAAAFRRLPCVEDADLLGKHPLFRHLAEIPCKKPKKTAPGALKQGRGLLFAP